MKKYLLRMFERIETIGKSVYCRPHHFEVELDENLDELSKWQLAKKQHPDYVFQDYVPLKDKLPNGWKKLEGTLTAPNGYFWASNGKSFFDEHYEHALIKE